MSRNFKLLFLGLLIIASGLFYVWMRNTVDIMMKKLSEKEQREKELITENRELKIDIERLSRSERIQHIAREQLKMVVPDPETLSVTIEKGQ
ncbi:MAG: cell division protein FtsL [Candidatus Marinimicrobia bacterium]|nr:cell division protein FtsL [Candidatus Neomarinimicrobiota bacterium]